MLVSRLLRSLLSFLSPGIVPDGAAAAPAPDAAAAPAADAPPAEAPAPAPAAEAPAPAPAPQPEQPFDLQAMLKEEIGKIGKPDAKDPTTPAPKPAEPKPAEPKTTDATAKPDAKDVDLTPPEGMSERATQRWSQLTERAKLVPQLEQRAVEAETQLQSVRSLVTKSGMDANEFSDMLEVARLLKSTNPQEATQAIARLDAIRADVAQRHGIAVAGVDPLAAHADLQAEVEAMTLTKERALEIAQLRARGKQAEAVTTEQRNYDQHVQSVNTARDDMAAALQQRAGTPGHDAKMAYIGAFFQDKAKLDQFVKTYQPAQWKAAALMMYDIYQPPAAPVAPPSPQPLRPGAVRPGAAVAGGPVTAESAVRDAFAMIGRS